jgi:chromosomal replication initiator protein
MSKRKIVISPYVFPGLKLDQKDKRSLQSSLEFIKKKISKEEILDIISEEFGVSAYDIVNRSRKRETVNARFLFCGIMKRHFGHSLTAIGDMVDGRDHTTIIHAITEYTFRMNHEELYRECGIRVYKRIGIEI